MCGISGYWAFNGTSDELKHRLPEAIQSIRYRGPDDSGFWFNDNIGLAHVRLSILDLSEHGHQPMVSQDGRYVIVFNGEIYNFKEIQSSLEDEGYVFISSSDTEVVLNAFSCWGKECVHKFIGMFAFAIFDYQNNKLFLCRDRVGVKPLYYSLINKVFYFASELKPIQILVPSKLEINKQALGEYFQYGYISAPRSIYQGTYKLPPGCWLEIQDGEALKIESYWSALDAVNKGRFTSTEKELEDELEELLKSSFSYRMISDVPVGVFLSGGIDSSLVAAILQKNSQNKIHTYTIGFKDERHDESIWAKKVAQHIGSDHTEFILDLDDAKDIVPILPEIYDEPFGDSSAIPTYMVSKLARQNVKVALSADGGDELFGGYSSYVCLPERLERFKRLPYPLRYMLKKLLQLMPTSVLTSLFLIASKLISVDHDWASKGVDRIEKIKEVLPDVKASELFDLANSYWLPPAINKLLGDYQNPRPKCDIYDGVFQEQMMQWDYHNYLTDDLLVKVDRATMANGLEGRDPLLDHRIVEFANRLPLNMKQGALGSKHLLRKILYRYVPRDLINRPKQGFSIPLDSWLRDDLSYLIDDYLNDSVVSKSGLLNVKEVSLLVNRFRANQGVSASRIWFLLMFVMWYESSR